LQLEKGREVELGYTLWIAMANLDRQASFLRSSSSSSSSQIHSPESITSVCQNTTYSIQIAINRKEGITSEATASDKIKIITKREN
jgi:hypothetical protein